VRTAASSSTTRALVLLSLSLLALAEPALASDRAVKEFARAWQAAGADEPKRIDAMEALARDNSEDAARLLLQVTIAPDATAGVVESGLRLLASLSAEDARKHLLKEGAKASDWPRRAVVMRVFGQRSDPEARDALIAALAGDRVWQVRAAAVDGLRRVRDVLVVDALIDAFEKLDSGKGGADDADGRRLAGDIRDALARLTGESGIDTAVEWRSWWTPRRDGFKFQTGEREGPVVVESGTVERAPKLFDEIISRRVLLVVDTSGSMLIETGTEKGPQSPEGLSRFQVLQRELERVVDELPDQARFNIVTFADSTLAWKDRLQPASKGNKREAKRFVSALRADGATNSYGALETAFKESGADTIYFLSDGYPTVGKTIDFTLILSEVRRWNLTRNLRIHTIAFIAGDGRLRQIVEDKSQAKEFMKRLASENGGRFRIVE